MVTLEQTLRDTHDWAIDRIHTILELPSKDPMACVDNAHAIQEEFSEWLDPNVCDHDIYSMEYLGDA
jgi:hypothetical protein